MGIYYSKPALDNYMIKCKFNSSKHKKHNFAELMKHLVFNKIDNEYNEDNFRRIIEIYQDVIYSDKKDYRLKKLYRSYVNIVNIKNSTKRFGFSNGYMEMLIEPFLVQDSKVIDEFNNLDQYFLQIVPMIYVNGREEKNKYNLMNRILREIGNNISNIISEINIFLGNPLQTCIDDLTRIEGFAKNIEIYFNLFYGKLDKHIVAMEREIDTVCNNSSPLKYNNSATIGMHSYFTPDTSDARRQYSDRLEFGSTICDTVRSFCKGDWEKKLLFTDDMDLEKKCDELLSIYRSSTCTLVRKLKNGINIKSDKDNISCLSILYNIKYYINVIKRAIKFRIDEYCYRTDSNYRYDWRHSKNMAIRWREYCRINIVDILGHIDTAISACVDAQNNKGSVRKNIDNCRNITEYYNNSLTKIEKEFDGIDDDDIMEAGLSEVSTDEAAFERRRAIMEGRELKSRKLDSLKNDIRRRYEIIVENLKLEEAMINNLMNFKN